ncbi:MAG: PhzF family phenazine biosynthesis protein [Proteocatella sp.]
MNIEVITLNSFARDNGGGNPAGVVFDADELNESQMLEIAAKVGFSETAFISKSNKADYRVRFFTPTSEVDLCGHATIGAFYAMFAKNMINAGKYTQETLAGVLEIEIKEDGLVLMQQNTPIFGEKIDETKTDFELVCKSLGINPEKIGIKNYVANIGGNELMGQYMTGPNILRTMQVVSTGLRDLIIPVEDIEALNSIKIDKELIIKISEKYDITGYHVFSLETSQEENTAQCRNFAPLFGIDEESATGTSSGALACYLYENNLKAKIKLNGTINMKFEQGYFMEKQSLINASVDINIYHNKPAITSVRVGGKAMDISKINIDI